MSANKKSVSLSNISEGSLVKIEEDGVPVEFYVACHNYESALNGPGRTLLVRKDAHSAMKWATSDVNAYSGSNIDTWLNGTYKNLLSFGIQSAMKTTTIPYTYGNGNVSQSTMARSVFLLSATEIGIPKQNWTPTEGTTLAISETLITCYYNGGTITQWTRTPDTRATLRVVVSASGSLDASKATFNNYARPCFTLHESVLFDSETMEFSGESVTELEYIESSGTQYIDTGFIPNQDTRVVAEMEYVSYSNATCALFGSGIAAHGEAFETFYLSGNYYFGFGSANYTATANVTTGKKMLIDLSKDRAVYDIGGTFLNLTPTASQTFTGQYELLIHAMHRGGSKQYLSVSRTYSFQIYDNGLLERDYIPAKTIEGEVGLYDRVFHEFYRNAGTGSFVAGPEMVHDGYTELEYVESSGTQYIDTGFKNNQDSRIVMGVQVVTQPSSHAWVFGARNSGTSGARNVFLHSGKTWTVDYNSDANRVQFSSVSPVDRVAIDFNKNVVSINGETHTFAATTFQCNYNHILFAQNDGGAVGYNISARLYTCQIYDNGTEIRAYIPMLHPSGVAGLWDSANERFYASATSTDLIAGPEKVCAPKAPGNFRVVSESDTEVALAWDAAENATGYRLYRNGALLADTTELAYTDTAEPFGTYTYTVSAYNEFGEGEAAELVVFLSPDNPILWLVTDRTQADVTAGNSKGVYQAVDLNRVGAAVKYLQKRLLAAGILANVSPRMDWADSVWMSSGEAQVYLDNVKTMRAALAMPNGTPAAPDDLAKLTYAEANHMEMFLVILDTLLTDIVFAYRHCGVTTCGMGGLIL